MARVLFINTGSEGHINPTIGIVQELVSRGEEVVYFTIEAFRERLEQAGASVRTIDEQKFIQAFISGGRRYMLERINGLLLTADVVIPSVMEQIRGEQFDYIIHDSMFGCGRLIAQMLKLPAVSSCTSFALSQSAFDRMLESFRANNSEEETAPVIERFHLLANEIQHTYKIELPTPYDVFCNPAPLTIVYTTKPFQPEGEQFDPSFKFVGPSLNSRSQQASFDFTAIEGKELIYISLGTVFNHAVEFYKLCFEAFADTDYTVVMSVGTKVQMSELGTIPHNFIVRPQVPQTDILPYAKLFITHGGMNSVHEGLYNGVPLIVLPQGADQPVVAGQVVKCGAGIELHMQNLTAEQLLQAAGHVLDQPDYRQAAAKVSQSFHQCGGAVQAVDHILAYINR